MTIQEQVAAAVAARGYRDGWTAHQFAARQVAKLAEEIGELSESVLAYGDAFTSEMWSDDVEIAALWAKAHFDASYQDGWRKAQIGTRIARAELADIQVVVFALAEALGEIDGEPFDVAQAALDKATQDIERGVR